MKRIINKPPYPKTEPYLPYQCYECEQMVRHAAPIVMHDDGTEDVCQTCWRGLDYGFFYTDDQIVQKWGLMALLTPNVVKNGRPQWRVTREFLAELEALRGPNRIRE